MAMGTVVVSGMRRSHECPLDFTFPKLLCLQEDKQLWYYALWATAAVMLLYN